MAKYSVTITTENELTQSWGDRSCPNLSWNFLEQTLEECLQEDGTYVATYESLEIPSGQSLSFTYLSGSGQYTYTLQEGEYGIKP